MNQDLQFESQIEEENLNKEKMNRHLKVLQFSLLFSFFKIFIFLSHDYSDSFYSTIMCLILFSAGFLANLFQKKNILISDIIIIRIILEVYVYLFSFLKINTISEYKSDFVYYFFIEQLIFNHLLNIPILYSFMSYSIHAFIIFLSYGDGGSWFFVKLVKFFNFNKIF
jgi:hypothetical protein